MRIVIIMPTYNERGNIARMIDVLFEEEFPKIADHEMHLLVVDDNSPDGTGEVVKEATKKYKNLHLMTGEKQGLGFAYIRGMKYAIAEMKADAVIEMDADFQHNPADVPRLVAASPQADVVIGSRYIKGGSVPKEWAFYRKFLSFGGNLFARTVLFLPQVHDLTTGFRLTKTTVLSKVALDSLFGKASYAYKIHLLSELLKLGAKVKEVPIAFLPRRAEQSKFKLKETLDTFIIVLRLRTRFLKFAIVGGIGFVINAVGLEVFRMLPWTQGLAGFFVQARETSFAVIAEPSFWAAAAAAELAIFSNFNLDNFWTFEDVQISGPIRYIKKFVQFNLTSFGAIVIQSLVIGTGVIFFGDTRFVRQIFLVIAVAFLIIPYNYTMYNLFIWKRWSFAKVYAKLRNVF